MKLQLTPVAILGVICILSAASMMMRMGQSARVDASTPARQGEFELAELKPVGPDGVARHYYLDAMNGGQENWAEVKAPAGSVGIWMEVTITSDAQKQPDKMSYDRRLFTVRASSPGVRSEELQWHIANQNANFANNYPRYFLMAAIPAALAGRGEPLDVEIQNSRGSKARWHITKMPRE